MPKGTTSRPYNPKEKAAAKREAARFRALDNLSERRDQAVKKGDLDTADTLLGMRGKILTGKPSMTDSKTLMNRRSKEMDRENYKYKDRPLNKVVGKAKGGTVSSSPRPKARPDYSKRPKARPEEIDMSPRAERNERKEVMGKKYGGSMKKMAGGGYVKKSPDGLAVRGKTRLKMKGCGKTG